MLNLSDPSAPPASNGPATVSSLMGLEQKTKLKPLLPRQRLFIQLVKDGNTHSAAYRVAYCKPDLSPQAAAHHAYKITTHPRVADALDRIRHDHDGLAPTLVSLEDRLKIVAAIFLSPTSTRYERLRAVELYTRIAGDGAPELPPWLPPSTPGANPLDDAPPSYRITLDIFRNAPSRIKAVTPIQVARAPAAAAPAGNGNGNGHH